MSPKSGKTFLLDVNVLLALAIHDHPKHSDIKSWFRSQRDDGFSTCAITQSGFIRLASNPGLYQVRFLHEGALKALQSITRLPRHRFWTMEVEYEKAVDPISHRITGYKQTTDAYLLGLAIHHVGKLATMDRGISQMAGAEFADCVEPLF